MEADRRRVLVRGFEEAELKFLGPGEGDGITFSKAGRAVMIGLARCGFEHTVEAQIGQTVGSDILSDLFRRMRRPDQLSFRRRINPVEAG